MRRRDKVKVSKAALSVNLNKVAWLRNARQGEEPSVLDAARTVLRAGAHGITVHPRSDMRHITPKDVYQLDSLLKQEGKGLAFSGKEPEFNIEGNPFVGNTSQGYPGFMALIEQVKPHQCTLVPDSEHQLTSDHGWDIRKNGDALKPIIERIQTWGVRVSLFMNADDVEQIRLAKSIGADRIELYTGPFAEAYTHTGLEQESIDLVESGQFATLQKVFAEAIAAALDVGLEVNAGHDLNQNNLPHLLKLGDIVEVSIGQALISEALFNGLYTTVKQYLSAMQVASI